MGESSDDAAFRLLSVRSARAAFLDRHRDHPGADTVVHVAAVGGRVARDLTDFLRRLSDWASTAARILAQVPRAPELPASMRTAAETDTVLGALLASTHQFVEQSNMTRLLAEALPSFAEFVDSQRGVTRDRDLVWKLGGAFALLAASQIGFSLRATDLALVAVAAEIDDPVQRDGDRPVPEADALRCDMWRKRLTELAPAVRKLDEFFARQAQPETAPPRTGA